MAPEPAAPQAGVVAPPGVKRPSEARLPKIEGYVPGLILDAGEQAGVRYRVCSTRGQGKRRGPLPRQDAVALSAQRDDTLDIVVADGVSGAPMSHRGATLACHFGLAALGNDHVDWQERIRIISWGMQQEWIAATDAADLTPEAQLAGSREAFATTVVAARVGCVEGSLHVEVGALGDSTFYVLSEEGLEEPLPPPAYEQENLTDALPCPPDKVRTLEFEVPPDALLIICTDGISRPLRRLREPYGFFADPPESVEDMLTLVETLRDSFGDDQTLVACWPTGTPSPDRVRTRRLVLDVDRVADTPSSDGVTETTGLPEAPDTGSADADPLADPTNETPPAGASPRQQAGPPPPPPPPTGGHIDLEG